MTRSKITLENNTKNAGSGQLREIKPARLLMSYMEGKPLSFDPGDCTRIDIPPTFLLALKKRGLSAEEHPENYPAPYKICMILVPSGKSAPVGVSNTTSQDLVCGY